MKNDNLFSLGMIINMLSGMVLYLSNGKNVLHWTTLIWITFNIGCYLINESNMRLKEDLKQ